MARGSISTQCFPFYTYDSENGTWRENIPLSTLVRFQEHYGDEQITKWDIFHYVYAVLHHPEYRTRYAANLRRELPHIPLVGGRMRKSSAAMRRSVGSSPICTLTTRGPPSIRSIALKTPRSR